MMNVFLQAASVADTLAGGNPVLTPLASGEPQMNLLDMAMKGGWIMAVLVLLSVVCFYIFFERLAFIRKAGKEDPLFMERIRDYIRSGEVKSAINYCRITNTPTARMIEKGITRMGRPVADVQAAIENTGNIEVAKLENGLPIVATISGGAPMIGFLGTVTAPLLEVAVDPLHKGLGAGHANDCQIAVQSIFHVGKPFRICILDKNQLKMRGFFGTSAVKVKSPSAPPVETDSPRMPRKG